MAVTIPKNHYQPIAELFKLSPDERNRLLSAVEAASPKAQWDEMAEEVSSRSGMQRDRVVRFLAVLLGMHPVFRGGQTDFVEGISNAIVQIPDFSGAERVRVHDFVRELDKTLQNANGLRVVAKVDELFDEEVDSIFSKARIVTEVRPVFDDESKPTVLASVLVHTLRIKCHGKERVFRITLDDQDLKQLRLTIDRALDKQAALEMLVRSTPLQVI